MARTLFIYGLFDPRDGELRYVGKGSTTLEHRRASHLCPSSLRAQTRKNGWLKSLLKRGLKPEAALLESVVVDDVDEAERYWISQARALGCRLTNMTDGGDGTMGIVFSAERRAKMSASLKGRPMPKWSAERRAKPSVLLGRSRSPEAIAKTAASRQGMRHEPAALRVMSERRKRFWAEAGAAERMSRAHGGRPFVDHLNRRYETIQGAARQLKIAASLICRVLKGQRPSTSGFTFRYIEAM